MKIVEFQREILTWYQKNRRDLPWRNTKDPYKILVSEIMLQQTQVSRVLPKYKEFLQAFSNLQTLAKASNKKLLKVWQGLGYWRRAIFLKETAKALGSLASKNLGAKLPSDPKALEKLPGIGHYTARALACFAFGNTEAFLDTNIRRVYLHFFFPKRKDVSDKEILQIAQKAIDQLPKGLAYREWHYALFDYGATVLKDKSINKRSRHYHKQSKFKGSFRSFRTKVVRHILAYHENRVPHKHLKNFLAKELRKESSRYSPKEIIDSLLKDKLLIKLATSYSV